MTDPHLARILVPVDGSGPSHKALRLAARLAHALGSELMLVHVGSLREHPLLLADKEIAEADGRGREVLVDCLRLTTAAGVTAQTTLLQGRASEQILRFARRYRPQLIVMGTRGLTGPKSLVLGSVSRDVSKGADCSVLLAR